VLSAVGIKHLVDRGGRIHPHPEESEVLPYA
jgi:hypothetical protein